MQTHLHVKPNWVGLDMKMGLHTNTAHHNPPHPPKLNFHPKEPQINLKGYLNNIKNKNNNKNNINNNKNSINDNNNNNETKQLLNNWVVTSS